MLCYWNMGTESLANPNWCFPELQLCGRLQQAATETSQLLFCTLKRGLKEQRGQHICAEGTYLWKDRDSMQDCGFLHCTTQCWGNICNS